MMENRSFASRWFKVVLLLAALLVGFILCEIATRVFLMATAKTLAQKQSRGRAPNGGNFKLYDVVEPSGNPRLFYELIPNRQGVMEGVPYRSNSFGMRAAEIAKQKGGNVWRVATLGDSTMFGWRVREEESYPAVLERALNSVGDKRKYEVLNFGIPGYNTAMEAELYAAKVASFDPDLVVLQFDVNDLALPNFVLNKPNLWTLSKSYFLSVLKGILVERSAVRALTSLGAPQLQEGMMSNFQTKEGVVKYFEYRASHTPKEYRYMVGWDGVHRALQRLWKESDEPVLHLSNPYSITDQELIKAGDEDRIQEFVEAGRKSGNDRLYFADFSNWGQEFGKQYGAMQRKDLVVEYPNDLHPSPVGHILLARIVYLSLVKNRLLPEGSEHYQRSDQVAKALWDEAAKKFQSSVR